MSAPVGRITLLTDFGTADGYVAAIKAVIAELNPAARVDDASHEIAPGDIRAAAWALGAYWRLYPPGTVHLAVVDPGVGSARRALAARIEGRIIVAPDNGLITPALRSTAAAACVELRNPALMRDVISATFHGRDIFAPAAAHLAAGVSLEDFGPALHDPVLLDAVEPTPSGGRVAGSVVHVDRFGNLVTDITAESGMRGRVVLGDRELAVLGSYADAAPGALLAVVGSRGTIEISRRDGSAAALLQVGRGTGVVLITASGGVGEGGSG